MCKRILSSKLVASALHISTSGLRIPADFNVCNTVLQYLFIHPQR
jgi:hypothetical protein